MDSSSSKMELDVAECQPSRQAFLLRQFKTQPDWRIDCFGVPLGILFEADFPAQRDHWQFRSMYFSIVFIPDNVNASDLVAAAARHHRHNRFPKIIIHLYAVFPVWRGNGLVMYLKTIQAISGNAKHNQQKEQTTPAIFLVSA